MYGDEASSGGIHRSVHDIPGRAMGIWAFVLSFLLPLLGLIFGVVALIQSRRAHVPNRLAIAGIVISIVLMLAAGVVTLVIASTVGFSVR
jgi:hypothetical protein